MCGFAAILTFDGTQPSPEALARMTAAVEHRGPDDEGSHVDGSVAFGFRRLAILDLSPLGHQPMAYGEGRYVIVFNGAIYNYRELRAQLGGYGYRFRSGTDTEVLLAAYAHWGSACLTRLNGMFAFLIHDTHTRTVFGARDRFGQKPMYRHRSPKALLIGSEIKAIRASGLVHASPNWSLVSQLLVHERMELVQAGGQTFFEGIEEVPPATAFEIAPDGRQREWTYWAPDVRSSTRRANLDAFRGLLTDAVDIHSRADVAIGVSLSGGMDSTTLACLVARSRGAQADALRAFSYVTPEFGEGPLIAETAERIGAKLDARDMHPLRAFELLPQVLWHHDEPVHSLNAMIGFDIYGRASHSDTKVVTGGQGADELLGGYTTGFRVRWASLIARGQVSEARRQIAAYVAKHGGSATRLFIDATRYVAFLTPSRSARYRDQAARRRIARMAVERPWCTSGVMERVPMTRYEPRPHTLREQLAFEQQISPLPLYLRIEDRNSMAHSVEARLPFLDTRIAEFAARMTDADRMQGPWNKALLREVTAGVIPESVRTNVQKLGFPIPAAHWIRGALNEPIRDLLTSAAARERGCYDVPQLTALLDRHRRGEIDASNTLFNVAQLEMWFTTVASDATLHAPQSVRVSRPRERRRMEWTAAAL